ncbi:MAG: hypothetical protein AAB541_02095 [Patescibacteria group bacterium]
MTTYSPEIHTAEALNAEIERIYRLQPGTLLVGSLGRAAAFKTLGYNPAIEFEHRGQDPLFAGHNARDIDVIIGQDTAIKDHPYEIDYQVFSTPRAKLIQDGSDWFLASDRKKFCEPLHPAVMEPVASETVHGINCTTVPVRTHLALFGLKGLMSPKMLRSRELTMRFSAIEKLDLPDELYKPFVELEALDLQGIYPFLQRHYRTLLPEHIRAKLGPITRPLKNLLP